MPFGFLNKGLIILWEVFFAAAVFRVKSVFKG